MVRFTLTADLHGSSDRSFMGWMDPLSYLSFQPVLHDWCNCLWDGAYPLLLLINKSSLCGGSGFPFSLLEWSLMVDNGR